MVTPTLGVGRVGSGRIIPRAGLRAVKTLTGRVGPSRVGPASPVLNEGGKNKCRGLGWARSGRVWAQTYKKKKLTPKAADVSQKGPNLERVDVAYLGERVRALGYSEDEGSDGVVVGQGGDVVLVVRIGGTRGGEEFAELRTEERSERRRGGRGRGGRDHSFHA